MEPRIIRQHLDKLLFDLHRPLTSTEIAELFYLRHGVQLSIPSIGANLGYLRAGGVVERKAVPRWGKPYWFNGSWRVATENWWWHKSVVHRSDAHRLLLKVRVDVIRKLTEHQRGKGRSVTYKLPARTDDMRQMVEDIAQNQ